MKNKIAFLGDSLTFGGRWQEYFPESEIGNFGVSGEKSADIIFRLDEVFFWTPQKIVLMMGINDLGDGLNCGCILEHFRKLILSVKKQKNIELIIQSILPINTSLFSNSNFGKKDILVCNQQINELCQIENIPFLDLYSAFSTYGDELIKEYTYDGLHLNDTGYQVWKNCLKSENII